MIFQEKPRPYWRWLYWGLVLVGTAWLALGYGPAWMPAPQPRTEIVNARP